MFQYLSACNWRREKRKTAHVLVNSFKFAPAAHICETGVRGYILADPVPINVARLARPVWLARITNEEEG
jgi:hypothetical protein